MADPELLKHPLFSSFPKGWSTRAVGPVLFAFKDPVKIPAEEYCYLTVDVLRLTHPHGLYISLQEEDKGSYCIVTVKIEVQNGKQDIKACYDISLKIDNLLKDIEIHE